MNKAVINITGQIGDYTDAEGKVIPGVKLEDVVLQFKAQPDAEKYTVYLNTPGGSVEVGGQIYDYLKTKPIEMVGTGMVASIGTKIFCAAPLAERKLTPDCVFMIHFPLLSNVTGNASQLTEAAKFLEPIEKEFINFYAEATGLGKTELSGFLKNETFWSAEQAVSLGFASGIVEGGLKAVAFSDSISNIKNQIKMEHENKSAFAKALKALADAAKGIFPEATAEPTPGAGREALAVAFTAPNGSDAETPYSDLIKGDPMTMADGSEAEDGEYMSKDGAFKVTVLGGVVDMIEQVAPSEDLQVQVVALQSEIEALKAENETLKAEAVALKAEQEAAAPMLARAAAILKQNKYVPQASAAATSAGAQVTQTTETARTSKEEVKAFQANRKK